MPDTITNGQAHIRNNLMGRFGVTHSYAMVGASSCVGSDYKPRATHKVEKDVRVLWHKLWTLQDDLRILAWALSDLITTGYLKPATKPTRRNRSKPFRQATIETRT